MTREEAIRILASSCIPGSKQTEALETLIPELRESEDERIRKRLIEYFEGFMMDDAEVKWEGLIVQEVLAWLEKQKENPKSTDSISSDCMSDVKCEDRWYKVTDSLPDNGRLVLAKDCLGNVLLARYDGENWEVNVYDNEDHYCRNSISKWCEIPSEKQKEQKPIIQDVELNDAVYDYVRDHFIVGADFTPEYIKKLMENAFFAGVDYYLLKQESESCEPDTNVEKVIEDVIRVYGKTQGEWVGGYDVDTLIVNLRRAFNKKEQKPAESISQLTVQGKGVYKICPRCKERMVRDDSMVYTSMPPQYRYECPKCGEREFDTVMYDNPEMEEQKPNSTEDMPYITDEHFYEREPADSFKYKLAEYMTRCCTKKEGPYGYEYGISAESILKMAEEELLKRGVVQKPTEWGEEDETAFGDLMWCIERASKFIKDENDMGNIWFAENWVKNRLKSIRPQKLDASELENFDPVDVLNRIKTEWPMAWEKVVGMPEWSQEDEHRRTDAIYFLESAKRHYADTSEIEKTIGWLKSIRPNQPKQEWSEKEYGRLFDIEHYLDGTLQLSPDRRIACIDFLKSLRSQSRWKPSEVCYGPTGDPDPAGVWKPSEEQMKALHRCVDYLEESDNEDAEFMESLLEQLKKL